MVAVVLFDNLVMRVRAIPEGSRADEGLKPSQQPSEEDVEEEIAEYHNKTQHNEPQRGDAGHGQEHK